jgi:hypothetical protein
MGASVSQSARDATARAYALVQADVQERTNYAILVRKAVMDGAAVDLSPPLNANGLTSFARNACVVRPRAGGTSAAPLECEYVAVLKCERKPNEEDALQHDYDAVIASLVTSLVEARVSPHFTMLYHANVKTEDGAVAAAAAGAGAGAGAAVAVVGKCMLLEANEITLHQFLAQTPAVETNVLQSMIFQVVHALLAAFVAFGISHNDLHPQNVMGVRVPPGTAYEYEFFGNKCVVPLYGWLWKLIDFNNADVNMSREHLDYFVEDGAEPSMVWGPLADVFRFLPGRNGLRDAYKEMVGNFVKRKGITAPGMQIEVLVYLLAKTFEALPEYKVTAPLPPSRKFSLNNDASIFDYASDGIRGTIAFRGARTYVIRKTASRPMPMRRTFGVDYVTSAPRAAAQRMILWRDASDEEPAPSDAEPASPRPLKRLRSAEEATPPGTLFGQVMTASEMYNLMFPSPPPPPVPIVVSPTTGRVRVRVRGEDA